MHYMMMIVGLENNINVNKYPMTDIKYILFYNIDSSRIPFETKLNK